MAIKKKYSEVYFHNTTDISLSIVIYFNILKTLVKTMSNETDEFTPQIALVSKSLEYEFPSEPPNELASSSQRQRLILVIAHSFSASTYYL